MIPPPPGQQATTERETAPTPLLDRVFPAHQQTPCCGEALIEGGTSGLAAHINDHLRRTA